MSPPLDLTDEERAALVAILTTEIEASRYPMSPRIVLLKVLRAKVRGDSRTDADANVKAPVHRSKRGAVPSLRA